MKSILPLLCVLFAFPAAAVDDDPERKGSLPARTIEAPTGLHVQQTSPREIVLTWQKVQGAQEYHVYVTPPLPGQTAERPVVVGSSGNRFVIPLSSSTPANTVYRASIEAVGARGVKSARVDFNPVMAQAPGPGGKPPVGSGPVGSGPSGTPKNPPTAGVAGQSCPAGQFVTGFSSSGALICARP
jgi:hypothetical protein